jgi:serine/threonine-protein kinase
MPAAEPTAAWDRPDGPLPASIGRYQILGRLGAGGMGTVYKARDPHLGRTVALKVPRADAHPEGSARLLERFQREARAAAQVWHPHVCPIYDVGEQDGRPFVVMAHVAGESLAQRLARAGRLADPGEAIALARQILDALGAIHSHGIVHRDLKPANVLLDGGRAVLTDFGLARPEGEGERLTSTGAVLGTPAYMAPEQAAGRPDLVGPWTDLYAAGVVLYEMLAGVLPPVVPGAAREPLSRLRPYLDPRLDAILLRATCPEPQGRYRSAGEFSDALAALTPSAPPAPTAPERDSPPAPPARTPPPGRDAPPWWQRPDALIAAALLALAGTCLVLGLMNQNGEAYAITGTLLAVAGGVLALGAAVRWWRQLGLTSKNRAGETWLMAAAKRGQIGLVKDLLARGAEVDEKDREGQTALMKAAAKGHAAVVRLLLAAGAEVGEKDDQGRNALAWAAAAGHPAVVALLEAAQARG